MDTFSAPESVLFLSKKSKGIDIMNQKKIYSYWFVVPAIAIFLLFFILPTVMSFFLSLFNWTFTDMTFTGLRNYATFLTTQSMRIGIKNTLIYSVATCGFKVIIGFFLGVFLTSKIRTKGFLRSVVFFPNVVSTIAVGITFAALMHPSKGLFNTVLGWFHINGPDWLGNTHLALGSVIFTDIWKGVGVATVIFIAGITAIDTTYYEAADLDGATGVQKIRYVTFPLSFSAMSTVITLSFISGLRCFDMIWAMTGGGPGFATDVMSSIIYKQYAAGYYGLSTAGNVILFIIIACLAFPLQYFLNRREEAISE